MTNAERKPQSGRERARTYRERMRAKGLRQVTIWAIDTRSPEFRAEAARQSQLIAESEQEADDLAWLESVQVDWGPYETDDEGDGPATP